MLADSKRRELSIDEALVAVGEWGLGQKRQVALAGLAWAIAAAQTVLVVFTGLGTDPLKSRLVECSKSGQAQCEAALAGNATLCSLPRDAWQWRWQGRSLVTEFDLVCSQAWLAQLPAACFFAGVLAGCVIWQLLSETVGRRRLLYTACLLSGLSGCTAATAAALWTHLLFRTLNGVGVGGLGLAAFVLATDLVGPSWRGFVGLLLHGGFSCGALLTTLLACVVPGWRWLTLLCALLPLSYLPTWSMLTESPSWLLLRGRKGEATAALAALAFANGTRPPEHMLADPAALLANPHRGAADLLRNGLLQRRCALLAACWAAVAACYFGLAQLADSLSSGGPGGDGSALEVALTGFAYELPGVAAAALAVERLGRRYTVLGGLLQAGTSLLAAAVTPAEAQRALAVAARFGLAAAFSALYLQTWELFPVVVQHPGMAVVNYGGRVGAVMSPLLAVLAQQLGSPAASLLTCGGLCLAGAALALALPETLGAPVHETIADFAGASVKRHRSWVNALRNNPPAAAPACSLGEAGRNV